MLMGHSRGVGALGMQAGYQLVGACDANGNPTGYPSDRSLVADPSGKLTCYGPTDPAFLALMQMPGQVPVVPIASNAANTMSGKVVSGVLQPPASGTFTQDIMLGSFDATAFVSSYWPWLLGGVGAIVLLTTVK